MDEDSDWGSWGLDPAATIFQQQQQQQQQSSTRSEILHAATSGKGTSTGAAAAHPTSSNGNVKSAPKKSTSRQSSITRLSTIMSQQSPPADTPADAHIQKLPLRQTSVSSQGSPSAADEWQSLLADTTAAPIKVQASKARPTLGPPKLQGAVSTRPSSTTGKTTSGPTPMTVTASPARQSAPTSLSVAAGRTDAAGTTAAGDTSGIATAGLKTSSSRVAGKAADLPSDSQRAISSRLVSAGATANPDAEISGTNLTAEAAGHPAGFGSDDLKPVVSSISHKAAAKPLGAALPTDAKGLPSGSGPARQRPGLFRASQALPKAMPGAAASKADQAGEAPPAMSGGASTSSASSAASEHYSKFMAGLPGRGQLPARGGLSERGQQPRAGRTAAAQTPKEGSSSSPSKAETSPLDASHSAVPGQGPPASVKTADVSLPKAAGISSAPEGSRQATAAEAAPSADTAAAPAVLSAAVTPAANIPSAPSALAAVAAAEPTGASASAGSSTAADSHTPASQTAAAMLRPSSKPADGAQPSLHADVRSTTSGRAAADAAAAGSPAASSPAADINTAPAKPNESYQQQPPSVFSDSSLVADSLATADQAEAAFSAAGQPLSYGGLEESKITPLDVEKEVDKAEQQSGFVPIPFGGSSSRPSFAATAVAAPFGSHMDLDSMDDSFFDSIGTGESVAVAPLAELQSQSGLISPYPTEPTPAPSYTQQLQAATELSVSASAAASPVSHRDSGGAHMSQELPSFHDWGQTGNLPSASVKSAASPSPTITPHPQPHAADSAPQLPAQLPVQPQQQLPEAAEALSDGLSQQEEEWVPDELMALQSQAAQQAAVALDLPEDFDDRQQGDYPQRQAFSIPFSGQSDPFEEEEDDLFGAGPSQEAGPFGATAPPNALPASEASFTFDDVDSQSQQQQSGHPQDQYDVLSHVMLTQLSHQQQQHSSQDTAMWPQSQSQPQPPCPAESQYQPQHLFQPQPQSLTQSQSQVSAAYQSQGQPQLPFQSQPHAQSQGQSQSQAGLFRPARQSSHGHAQAQAPQLFMPQSSATQGIAYCQPPSIPTPPFQQAPSMPPSLPFQQFPSTIPSPPFQQQPGPAQTPWDSTHIQSQMLNPSLPLQLSVNTQRLSSPHAVDNGQQSQPDVYDQGALWPGLNQVAALEQPQQQGQSMWPGPNQVAAVEQPQQQGQSMWPHQAAFAEAAVESHATAEFEPNMGAPTLHGVSSGASQQHDRWAGQHVPSQGFSPHLSPLLPSHGANPLNPPGYSPGQIPAAPVASAAASSFPTTMSSPFAQAGYPPQSDPWAFEPEPSSSLPPAQPGYPPSSSAQPANIWAPVATHPGANPWDPSAAGSSPWDSGVAGQAPAGLGGEYGGQDSEYRSPDGRPAVPLMVFGFAGKMYCWRPATSSSGIAGGGNGFGGSSVGTLQFLSWPKLVTETTPAQQQQQQQQPPHRPQAFQESSMSATHALLTHFPGPLMPNTHKDKVLKYVSEACDSCLEREPQCREPGELLLLWKVVQLLCQHKGDLHSALTPGVNDKRPEALLAALLAPAQTHLTAAAPPSNDPWSGGSAGFGGSAQGVSSQVLQPLPGFGDLQQAAGQMQQLLMAGHRLEALRVAVGGKLWGPALLLARHCSEKAFLETAAAMAEGSTTMGSPLHTLTLLMSGKADAVHAVPAVPGPDSNSKQQAASVQYGSPFAQPVPSEADAVLSQWRGNMAIMAANRVAGEEAAMVKLGDRLWQERSQAVAGHICYVLAGLHVQPHGPASQVCLVGADHHSCPRCFATISALQRSEVLEWARSQGNSSYTLQHGLMLLPYKFLYAAQLAEHGLISEAAQYCGAIQQALGAVPKLPPSLAVCRAFTQDLLERLQTYAAAHNIPLQMSRSGSVLTISGVGRWIDRGLSKLMGGPEQPPQSGPGSSGSTQSEIDPYVAKSKHRRNTSDQHLGSDTPKVVVPKRSQSSQDMGQLHHRSAKATPSLASTPEKDSDPSEDLDNGQKASSQGAGQAPNGQTQKAGGLGWEVMSRVASGLLGSGSKKGAPDKKVTEAKLGDENKFYYDNELKQWRVQGEEAPPPSGPPPPPPKLTPQRSASGSLAAGLTKAPSSGPPFTSGRPPLPGAGPPSSGPSSGGQPAGSRSAVRSRYVSNFSSASMSSPAATAIPLVPQRAFGAPRAASQPAQLFQPSAPAASVAASEPSSSDRGVHTAHALSQSADDAVPSPPTAFGLPQGQPPPVVRGSSNGGGAPQLPFGSTAAVPRHNPYAQMAGVGTSVASAGMTSGAARGRPSAKQSMAPASQQHVSVSGTAENPASPQLGSLDQQLPELFAPRQNASSTPQDLVTTYSSFAHDPMDPYTAFGSGPAATYSASGKLLGSLDGSDQTSAIMTAYQDDGTEHGNNSGDRFDDMTELQL